MFERGLNSQPVFTLRVCMCVWSHTRSFDHYDDDNNNNNAACPALAILDACV